MAQPSNDIAPPDQDGDSHDIVHDGVETEGYVRVSRALPRPRRSGYSGADQWRFTEDPFPRREAGDVHRGEWLNCPTAGIHRRSNVRFKTQAAVGAVALRSACLGTRRYETFTSLADWQNFVDRSHTSLESAVPILDRYKIPLGLENHKDWTVDEMVALIKKYSSEYLGVCLDFGNNISLLDDPDGSGGEACPVYGINSPEEHGR